MFFSAKVCITTGTPALHLRQNAPSGSDIVLTHFHQPPCWGKGVHCDVYHRQPTSSIVSAASSSCSIYRPFASSLSEQRHTLGPIQRPTPRLPERPVDGTRLCRARPECLARRELNFPIQFRRSSSLQDIVRKGR